MAFSQITDADIASYGVVASPTVMGGTAEENKRVFDRLVREIVKPRFNALVTALSAATGASELGAYSVSLTASTVGEQLEEIRAQLTYTAMMTDTLPDEAEAWFFDRVEDWYEASRWAKTRVHDAVEKGWLTPAQYEIITGEEYSA